MRRKHTFLLTIFPSEGHEPALHGRVEFIANGLTYNFTNLSDLQNWIEGSIRTQQNCITLPSIHDTHPSYQPRSSGYPGHCEEEVNNTAPTDTSLSM